MARNTTQPDAATPQQPCRDSIVQVLKDICYQAHKHEVQYWLDAPGTDAEKLNKIIVLAREALYIARTQFETTHRRGMEFSDGQHWFGERDVCRHCFDACEADGGPYRFADERHSFGVYAGRYCDDCWKRSGYRDATDPTAQFDPLDAGERMDEDD